MKNLHIPEEQTSTDRIPRISWNKSLRFRFTLIFIVMQLLLGGVAMIGLASIYQSRIENEYINKAAIISRLAASFFDGDTIDRYLETLETDAEYDRLLDILRTMQSDTGVEYIYISRVTDYGELFVFDVAGFELGTLVGFDDLANYRQLISAARSDPYITNTAARGWLVTGYEPIFRADGSVAAYAGVDIFIDRIMRERMNALALVGLTILLISCASIAVSIYAVQKYLISPMRMLATEIADYRPDRHYETSSPKLLANNELAVLEYALTDMRRRNENILKELKKAEKLTTLMFDACPLCCSLWNDKLEMVDCNEAVIKFYGLKNKQEYMDRFFELMPEYQPDGRLSREKAEVLLKKAFEEDILVFDWMYKMTDGSVIPTQITLVRVSSDGQSLVAGYTRDLRETEQAEEKIRHLEMQVQQIYYDALTGIHNRRYFDENFERVIKSMSRSESLFSLMMLDIDKFGIYNNTYGHVKGDDCLRIIAGVIEQNITRDGDFVARYGGEEFVIVLPNTDENGARMMASKILENIVKLNMPHETSDVADYVTVSIGVATIKADYTKPKEDYVDLADKLLYESKQNGRNRYTFGYFEG